MFPMIFADFKKFSFLVFLVQLQFIVKVLQMGGSVAVAVPVMICER